MQNAGGPLSGNVSRDKRIIQYLGARDLESAVQNRGIRACCYTALQYQPPPYTVYIPTTRIANTNLLIAKHAKFI